VVYRFPFALHPSRQPRPPSPQRFLLHPSAASGVRRGVGGEGALPKQKPPMMGVYGGPGEDRIPSLDGTCDQAKTPDDGGKWWTRRGSNLRPSGYEPRALTTELRVLNGVQIISLTKKSEIATLPTVARDDK
jgi:hypothetical protein